MSTETESLLDVLRTDSHVQLAAFARKNERLCDKNATTAYLGTRCPRPSASAPRAPMSEASTISGEMCCQLKHDNLKSARFRCLANLPRRHSRMCLSGQETSQAASAACHQKYHRADGRDCAKIDISERAAVEPPRALGRRGELARPWLMQTCCSIRQPAGDHFH